MTTAVREMTVKLSQPAKKEKDTPAVKYSPHPPPPKEMTFMSLPHTVCPSTVRGDKLWLVVVKKLHNAQ